ncbi:type II toxin-antitoxin system VapC family toxin [Natronosporangium hydrolyticum]|uniref:Ribonuclease VapC n=1 Tax=Natronosporangium hydrolyticum TaxID=2811111 RepID=A0A895YC12_9ACTN|nr:type II toxin-antitoxin system VapC family toxin [Natronosporangium hydrolyticum]QSB14991.1 type II toxin-antitoxin system VapC family toxin [Natronosporangium hydrolyticum]
MTPARGLLDTSVFIAAESGRPLAENRLPAELATTVVTLAELQAGVLAAGNVETRAQRMATLDLLSEIQVLPVDQAAGRMWAQLRAYLAAEGRRIRVNDLWIAAIAATRGLPVVTQDDDFDAVDGVAGVSVIRV